MPNQVRYCEKFVNVDDTTLSFVIRLLIQTVDDINSDSKKIPSESWLKSVRQCWIDELENAPFNLRELRLDRLIGNENEWKMMVDIIQKTKSRLKALGPIIPKKKFNEILKATAMFRVVRDIPIDRSEGFIRQVLDMLHVNKWKTPAPK